MQFAVGRRQLDELGNAVARLATASLSGNTAAQQQAARNAITAKASDGLADVCCPSLLPALLECTSLKRRSIVPTELLGCRHWQSVQCECAGTRHIRQGMQRGSRGSCVPADHGPPPPPPAPSPASAFLICWPSRSRLALSMSSGTIAAGSPSRLVCAGLELGVCCCHARLSAADFKSEQSHCASNWPQVDPVALQRRMGSTAASLHLE